MQKIFTILAFGVLFTAILANPAERATCSVNYAPCVCYETANGLEITCTNLTPADVRVIFYRTIDLDYYSVRLTLVTTNMFAPITLLPDQLGRNRVEQIFLNCPISSSPKDRLTIDDKSFEYSALNITVFEINDCDLSEQSNFNFLTGFEVLDTLRFRRIPNVEFINMLRFDALKELTISECSGLGNVAATFPDLTPAKLERLYLDGNGLTDSQVNSILVSVGNSSVSSLQKLSLSSNALSIVPEITSYSQLVSYDVAYNNIAFLNEAAMIFVSQPIAVFINNANITAIAGGAFQGDYSFAHVYLSGNRLIEFREDVFKVMLQQMAAQRGNDTDITTTIDPTTNSGGQLFVNNNPFGCGCELAWLIHDNRDLIPSVYGGVCDGSYKFEDLNPDLYTPEKCPRQ